MKKTLKMVFIAIILNNWVQPLYSQMKQSHSIISGFLQLKEEFNIGMVFNGVQFKICIRHYLENRGIGINVSAQSGLWHSLEP
jgi:hypothetical protein